jgi:hypothetical protein
MILNNRAHLIQLLIHTASQAEVNRLGSLDVVNHAVCNLTSRESVSDDLLDVCAS